MVSDMDFQNTIKQDCGTTSHGLRRGLTYMSGVGWLGGWQQQQPSQHHAPRDEPLLITLATRTLTNTFR